MIHPDAKVNITYENKTLICSGLFFSLGSSDSIIDIEYQGEKIRFRFLFINDKDKPEMRKEVEVLVENDARIKFYNYSYSSGIQTVEPWRLGTINDKPLFIVYKISQLENTQMKLIQYAFYVEETNSGKN